MQDATGNTVVRFENVGMRYGLGPEVLRNVNFTLTPGSFHFLTGPSGAGKTSLLKLLYLAHRPSRGLITLFGTDVATLTRERLPDLRRRIGVVFQEFRLIDHLNIFDNVALPLRIAGHRLEDYREDVTELISWVGLGEKIKETPPTLSGGEKQRVAIARAVVAKPSLLLADEPTGNVDPDMGMRLMRLFIELNKLGTSIIIATHDRAFVEAFPAPEMRIQRGELAIHAPARPQSARSSQPARSQPAPKEPAEAGGEQKSKPARRRPARAAKGAAKPASYPTSARPR
ncbi:MAG: cell division ATP-binding protein FtsE [Pseudomonadota bacterium]